MRGKERRVGGTRGRKRDEENKRAAERAGTLFLALLKIHKALCLLTKDTRLAPVAPQSCTPLSAWWSAPPRFADVTRDRALSRKIKLLVALFSTRAARELVPLFLSSSSSFAPRESRCANFSATFKPKQAPVLFCRIYSPK